MSTPAIIYIVLSIAGLLVSANQHGKIREKPQSFWYALVAAIIVWSLLWWGGFFN